MKKRLRKKLHRGEFTAYGFDIKGEVLLPPSGKWDDAAMDRFSALIDALYAGGIEVGGGAGPDGLVLCAMAPRQTTATEDTRAQAAVILAQFEGTLLASFEVGPLIDAWK